MLLNLHKIYVSQNPYFLLENDRSVIRNATFEEIRLNQINVTNSIVYIERSLVVSMKQILQLEQEQDTVSPDRSIGNLFEEFLEINGKIAQGDFDQFAENVMVSVIDENDDRIFLRSSSGFPATVKQMLKTVIKSKDLVGLKFHPRVAGG